MAAITASPPNPTRPHANARSNGNLANGNSVKPNDGRRGEPIRLRAEEEKDPIANMSSRRGRRKEEEENKGSVAGMCAWIVDHQISLAINLLFGLGFTHLCFPQARIYTRKFFQLSYCDHVTGRYLLGMDDVCMVLYWIIVFTGLRALVMGHVLVPFARWGGVRRRKIRVRFAEQAWLFLYAVASFSVGMYIFYHSDYWLNFGEMWTGWPKREMDGLVKWYYLAQFAFWLQQILVVNIEERRKDYHQMFTHHIITCSLIFASYGHHHTRVGNVILCLMDVVDIILPLAKMLKYLHFQLACDVAFAVFMLTWVVARHVLYLLVFYSAYEDTKDRMPYACFGQNGELVDAPPSTSNSFVQLLQPFLDPEGIICFNPKVKWTFLGMLLALQAITLIWFGMILRVAWRILNGGIADDTRSEDEHEEDEVEVEVEEKGRNGRGFIEIPSYVEEEVGVEAINFKGRRSVASPSSTTKRKYRKATGGSGAAGSRPTLAGHSSDRKELLGRIGCDKTS